MSVHRLQITAAPTEGAPVLVDLATEEVAAQSDGFDLGEPDTAFDQSGREVEAGREVTIPLLIRGAGSVVGILLQDIARAVSVPDRWLCVQRTPATDPVWFRIHPRSPGTLDIRDAYVDAPNLARWTRVLTLTVDSTAVGSQRAVPMVDTSSPTATVTNNGADRGLVIDAPGEAPVPLRVDVKPAVNINGRRPLISTFTVPWDSPLLNGGRPAIIREDMDFSAVSGHSTRTTGHGSMSGGTALTVTLDSTSNRQVGVTSSGSTWRPEPGRYLVLARLFREGGAGEIKIRMGQSWATSTALQPWRTWRPLSGASRASWMPVGYLQHPLGDAGDGLQPSELMPPMIRFDITPTLTSSTGLVHLDQVAFIPVDLARGSLASACFADFADGVGFGGNLTLRVDGEKRRVAVVDFAGNYHAIPQPLRTGGWPIAVPGMATCVNVFLDTSDAPAGIESITHSSQVQVDASPRLLHLGQER